MSRSGWATTPVKTASAGYTSNLIDPPFIGWKFTTANIVKYGMGKHIWDVSLADYSPHFLLMWTMSAVVYIVAMLSTKSSILNEEFGWRWWLVTLFTFGYSIGGIVATIFSCTPTSSAWYVSSQLRWLSLAKDIKDIEVPGHCINTPAFYVANGTLNSVSDVMVLMLPLPIILGLVLKTRDKLTLCGLFGPGGISCIMSIVHLKVLIEYLKNNVSNATYYLGSVGVWTRVNTPNRNWGLTFLYQ